jgi:hypothetical protein
MAEYAFTRHLTPVTTRRSAFAGAVSTEPQR